MGYEQRIHIPGSSPSELDGVLRAQPTFADFDTTYALYNFRKLALAGMPDAHAAVEPEALYFCANGGGGAEIFDDLLSVLRKRFESDHHRRAMSMEYWLRGRLEIDAQGRKAAEAQLQEAGYADDDDNLLGEEQLVWAGDVLTVDERGSAPMGCFDTSACVLSIYSNHAKSGEALSINIEDGVGDRYPAGADSIELTDDEVDAFRAEYGWQTS